MNLEEAKLILEVQASRMSGLTTRTEQRDAARVILDHLADRIRENGSLEVADDRSV